MRRRQARWAEYLTIGRMPGETFAAAVPRGVDGLEISPNFTQIHLDNLPPVLRPEDRRVIIIEFGRMAFAHRQPEDDSHRKTNRNRPIAHSGAFTLSHCSSGLRPMACQQ